MASELFNLVDEKVAYKTKIALQQITLKIERGEKIALIGPSGSGKTTLLYCLHEKNQSQNPNDESVFVHQDYALVPQLSVFHNVYIGRLDRNSVGTNLKNLIWPQSKVRAEIESVLKDLDLVEQINQRVGTLSGGQQQRTAIARAVYRGGRLFLADEPVASIDIQQAKTVLDLIFGRTETVIASLHAVNFARQYAHRIIGLRQGRFFFDSPSEEVTDDMLNKLYHR